MPSMAQARPRPASEFQVGMYIKWDHLTWHRITEVTHDLQWVYLRLENRVGPHSLWHDVELPSHW